VSHCRYQKMQRSIAGYSLLSKSISEHSPRKCKFGRLQLSLQQYEFSIDGAYLCHLIRNHLEIEIRSERKPPPLPRGIIRFIHDSGASHRECDRLRAGSCQKQQTEFFLFRVNAACIDARARATRKRERLIASDVVHREPAGNTLPISIVAIMIIYDTTW